MKASDLDGYALTMLRTRRVISEWTDMDLLTCGLDEFAVPSEADVRRWRDVREECPVEHAIMRRDRRHAP